MIETSCTFRMPLLLSPRTANYVAALLRDGDNFDFSKWLQRVREEEHRATDIPAPPTSRDVIKAGVGRPFDPPNCRGASHYPSPALMTRATPLPRILRRPSHEPARKTAKAQVHRRLAEIHIAWDAFQANRARDAVYGYLEAVFAIVKHYKVRRRTKKLLRHAFEFAGLPFDEDADPFTAIIRCPRTAYATTSSPG
jgi:hypothetical protein